MGTGLLIAIGLPLRLRKCKFFIEFLNKLSDTLKPTIHPNVCRKCEITCQALLIFLFHLFTSYDQTNSERQPYMAQVAL